MLPLTRQACMVHSIYEPTSWIKAELLPFPPICLPLKQTSLGGILMEHAVFSHPEWLQLSCLHGVMPLKSTSDTVQCLICSFGTTLAAYLHEPDSPSLVPNLGSLFIILCSKSERTARSWQNKCIYIFNLISMHDRRSIIGNAVLSYRTITEFGCLHLTCILLHRCTALLILQHSTALQPALTPDFPRHQ